MLFAVNAGIWTATFALMSLIMVRLVSFVTVTLASIFRQH